MFFVLLPRSVRVTVILNIKVEKYAYIFNEETIFIFRGKCQRIFFIGIAHVWYIKIPTYPEALRSKLQTFHDSIVSQLPEET